MCDGWTNGLINRQAWFDFHFHTLITPHHKLELKTATPRHIYYYNYICNCAAPHYIQQLWSVDHCNHCSRSRKHNSNHLSVHQWIQSAIRGSKQPTSPIGFLFLKLPPPPCAVLLVTWSITTFTLKYSPLIHDMVPGKST